MAAGPEITRGRDGPFGKPQAGMNMSLNHRAIRKRGVAMNDVPGAERVSALVNGEAANGVQAPVMIAGNHRCEFNTHLFEPEQQPLYQVCPIPGLEQVAGDDQSFDLVGPADPGQRCQDRFDGGGRNGLAPSLASLSVTKMQIGNDHGCCRKIDGGPFHGQQPISQKSHPDNLRLLWNSGRMTTQNAKPQASLKRPFLANRVARHALPFASVPLP